MLKIKSRWRWLVMDRGGYWYVHDTRPECCGSNGWRGNEWEPIDAAIFDLPDVKEWRDSLHEILPDGTLKKYVERPDLRVDDRVLVRDNPEYPWIKRHFAAWGLDGRIKVFSGGYSNWSNVCSTLVDYEMWKLPEDNQ